MSGCPWNLIMVMTSFSGETGIRSVRERHHSYYLDKMNILSLIAPNTQFQTYHRGVDRSEMLCRNCLCIHAENNKKKKPFDGTVIKCFF